MILGVPILKHFRVLQPIRVCIVKHDVEVMSDHALNFRRKKQLLRDSSYRCLNVGHIKQKSVK